LKAARNSQLDGSRILPEILKAWSWGVDDLRELSALASIDPPQKTGAAMSHKDPSFPFIGKAASTTCR